MEIYLSINNREEVMQIPVLPPEFKINDPQNNDTFTTIRQGDIKLIGLEGLKSFSLSSFFPNKEYYFSQNNEMFGWDYVETIERWKKRRLPLRLIITGTPINWAVAIDSFEYGTQDGTGDIYYTMTFTDFPFIRV
ncbi:hypothetical protein [Salimicrobium halophilum]|uniref:Uncharacterized protein n=1 Tax=Salimicrobium halophilum TaxID=86666 RepID=A0A1G8WD57_9BACI|nr:hypothetical protein [Salimicrobium halophilum]SDJ76182.1 hypothetical protein SAMN04490247_3126 [Salimicrobium halophilum]